MIVQTATSDGIMITLHLQYINTIINSVIFNLLPLEASLLLSYSAVLMKLILLEFQLDHRKPLSSCALKTALVVDIISSCCIPLTELLL